MQQADTEPTDGAPEADVLPGSNWALDTGIQYTHDETVTDLYGGKHASRSRNPGRSLCGAGKKQVVGK